MSGDPTASVYVAIPLSTDTGATPTTPAPWETITGHPYFAVGFLLTGPDQPVPCKLLMGAVVLGDTAPTITDPAGLTITPLHDPIAIPGATFSLWTVDIPTLPDPSTRILLSETIDSGFALYLPLR
jgi:hypothetical protein